MNKENRSNLFNTIQTVGGCFGILLTIIGMVISGILFFYSVRNPDKVDTVIQIISGGETSPQPQIITVEVPVTPMGEFSDIGNGSPTQVIQIPFSDNFDTGLASLWEGDIEEWAMVNGKLVSNSNDAILLLGDESWNNYKISFEFTDKNSYPGYSCDIIMMRFEGTSVAFRISGYDFRWIKDNSELPNSKQNWPNPNPNKVVLQASNGVFKATIDGTLESQTIVNGRNNGGIAIYCETDGLSFDDFSVEPIQE